VGLGTSELLSSRSRSTTIISDKHMGDYLRGVDLAKVDSAIAASDATLDMDISPMITTKDLKPESNESLPSHADTSQHKSHLIEKDLECYPTKFRSLARAILQLSGNRTDIHVDFEAVQKLIGSQKDIKALNFGFATFTGMVNEASQEKCIEQGVNMSNEKWLALLPVCSISLVWYYCDLFLSGMDHEHRSKQYFAKRYRW
jgi:hypothetical protein